jgi:hypothetical protein
MKPGFLLLSAALVACSSSESSTPTVTDTGATATDTATGGDDTAPADTGTAEVSTTKPATPDIVSVVPMAGAWHVTWDAKDTGLTKIELWRSNDGAAATLVKAFGGTAKDWHDGAAPGTTVKYCYTVKTFRGELASDPSAEKCSK